MAISTRIKEAMNRGLSVLNLRLDTLTAGREEDARLGALAAAGRFSRPTFPVPPAFSAIRAEEVLAEVARHEAAFRAWASPAGGPTGFSLHNEWFRSPDAEVLYALLRSRRPRRIVEIGCGNSTRVARQAIRDGGLDTELVCIDPRPLRDVSGMADRLLLQPVESLREGGFPELGPGDVLFIDSSHVAAPGGDVVFLLLEVLPALPPGVLVHVHDVYLPLDYPESWVVGERRGYDEQYILQAWLAADPQSRVLWASSFLSHRDTGLASRFPWSPIFHGSSLWFVRVPEGVPEVGPPRGA